MFRRIAPCLAALAVAVASVIDNPALCREDLLSAPDARDAAPPHAPASCVGMPCNTPGEQQVPLVAWPLFAPERTLEMGSPEPMSADSPTPPTPPPTALA